MAKPYQDDIDFAFFVVNFNYTKRDYDELTEREKAFIYKAWEQKMVNDDNRLNAAVANAISNTMRSKKHKYVPLWRKIKTNTQSSISREEMLEIAQEIDDRDGRAWIKKLYQGVK